MGRGGCEQGERREGRGKTRERKERVKKKKKGRDVRIKAARCAGWEGRRSFIAICVSVMANSGGVSDEEREIRSIR